MTAVQTSPRDLRAFDRSTDPSHTFRPSYPLKCACSYAANESTIGASQPSQPSKAPQASQLSSVVTEGTYNTAFAAIEGASTATIAAIEGIRSIAATKGTIEGYMHQRHWVHRDPAHRPQHALCGVHIPESQPRGSINTQPPSLHRTAPFRSDTLPTRKADWECLIGSALLGCKPRQRCHRSFGHGGYCHRPSKVLPLVEPQHPSEQTPFRSDTPPTRHPSDQTKPPQPS